MKPLAALNVFPILLSNVFFLASGVATTHTICLFPCLFFLSLDACLRACMHPQLKEQAKEKIASDEATVIRAPLDKVSILLILRYVLILVRYFLIILCLRLVEWNVSPYEIHKGVLRN